MDAAGAGISGAVAAGALKDTTGAQVISKTLDKLNSVPNGTGGMKLNADYDFQKTVLNAAGIGNKLDSVV